MKKIFALYDSRTCEIIRAYSDMESAIVAAMNRVVFFCHTCVGFSADEHETIIEYRDHDTGVLYALDIQETELHEGQ